MKKIITFTLILLCTKAVLAQDFWSAKDLDGLSNSLSDQVGPNNAAILNNIIQEGGYYAAMVHREAGPGFSERHAAWADLYFVVSGSATIATGGSIVDETEYALGEVRGTSIEGGTVRRIGKGDVVHIPAGLPHYVMVGEGEEITYFIFKAQGQLDGERAVNITAIPGVVSEGARWQSIWADEF
ncbi:MAG: hypothetical protein HOK55_05490, partial [Gammaproteobacteria bacterium]|nr:hypothetical protein [Gammaproteobacteria bacterium]